jgi:hypothetical protein
VNSRKKQRYVSMLMKHLDKVLFAFAVLALVYAFGMATVQFEIFPYKLLHDAKEAALDWKRHWRTYLKIAPSHFIYPAVYAGDGVVRHVAGAPQPGVTFMTGLRDQHVAMWVVDLDGKLLKEWQVDASRLWPEPTHLQGYARPRNDWEAQVHGAVLLPDGDVIFNLEFIGLIRLSRCGDVVWRLPYMTHHSVYRNGDGTLWVSGRKYHDRVAPEYPGMRPPFWEPTALQVSTDGKILQEISLLDILYGNRQEALIFASGPGGDWAHLNDVEIVESRAAVSSAVFDQGDILASLRDLHLLFVFSPITNKIKWMRTGPWLNQHDPDILPDGTISIFDNRRLRGRGEGEPLGGMSRLFDGSRILSIDPASDAIRTVYEGTADNPFYTNVMGKHQDLDNGNLLIAQSEGGRVFEIADNGEIVWEYINRYDEDNVAVIQQADRYPLEYARLDDGDCP